MTSAARPGRRTQSLFVALLAGLAAAGCSGQAGGNGNDNASPGNPQPPLVQFISPTLDRALAAGQVITVTYSMVDAEQATAYADPDPEVDGDEIAIATNLGNGPTMTFNFDTNMVPVGRYALLIEASNSSGAQNRYAQGPGGAMVFITVDGPPRPAVLAPLNNVFVQVGISRTIDIEFACNDPEGSGVTWEVFHDLDGVLDGDETAIDSGAGSTGRVAWSTTGLAENTYSLGVSCTDQVGSTASAFASGKVTVSNQAPIPTITVTQPQQDRDVFADETFNVNFLVGGDEAPKPTAKITVFVDDNQTLDFDDSEIILRELTQPFPSSVQINSSTIVDGTYNVGAYLEQDGQRNFDYAPGRIRIVGVGNLAITSPAESELVAVRPGTDVAIRWDSNVPSGRGLIELALVEATNGSAVPFDPFANAEPRPVTPGSAVLDTSALPAGSYRVRVTLTLVEEDGVTPSGEEPQTKLSGVIRVSTLPSILWVGAIEIPESRAHIDGVVFEGLQFQDNAGSDILGVGNIDDQPGDDFIIAARFAKPFFVNPGGVGAGEAYLIYSDPSLVRSNRRFSLNSVGLAGGGGQGDGAMVPGMVFLGMEFNPQSEDINGDGQLTACYTENAHGTQGVLDEVLPRALALGGVVSEDSNGDGLEAFEDVNNNGLLDFHEDGLLWLDLDCDGAADEPVFPPDLPGDGPFLVPGYVNGVLDTMITEDRDGDGRLDTLGDNTLGLSSLGLLPDSDDDGKPELAFGFARAESVRVGRRSLDDIGSLTQPRQAERGAVIIVPTNHEPAIGNRSFGNNTEPIMLLDQVGQVFETFVPTGGGGGNDVGDCCEVHDEPGCSVDPIQAGVCLQRISCCLPPDVPGGTGWDAACVAMVEDLEFATCLDIPPGLNSNTGPGIVGEPAPARPRNGMDAYPLVADVLVSQEELTCPNPGTDIVISMINNTAVDLVARPVFNATAVRAGGGEPQDVTIETFLSSRGAVTSRCVSGCSAGDQYTIQLLNVQLLNPENQAPLATIGVSSDATFEVTCGEGVVFSIIGGLVPSEFDAFGLCGGAGCFPEAFGLPFGCDQAVAGNLGTGGGNGDGCPDTLVGPLFGFFHAGLGIAPEFFESPTHPLAYADTLANPLVRAEQLDILSGAGGCFECSRELFNPAAIGGGLAPPFTRVASGFYPGKSLSPIGARILGERVNDAFGSAISFVPSGDRRVFVSSPNRGAGEVYQWPMQQYWDTPVLSGGLSTVDGFEGIPKPHQYIIGDVGYTTPDGLDTRIELSLSDNADRYVGAEDGDRLGAGLLAIQDFNGDVKEDIVMGAPGARTAGGVPNGRVYIIYRRPTSVGGVVPLEKLELPILHPERLNGMLINGDPDPTGAGLQMGEVLAGNCDLNGDSANDVIIGVPRAANLTGEVVVVFGSTDPTARYLPSPEGGYSISDLVALDPPKALRIRGVGPGDQAGFNVACGDFNGDDVDDLVISAPTASPRVDNGDDVITEADVLGLDLDGDGQADALDLNRDGVVNDDDTRGAGLVYVITTVQQVAEEREVSLSEMGGRLQGLIIAGQKGGDQLGGGVTGNLKPVTRSRGLTFVGDLDGDGREDLAIGAINADPGSRTDAGEVYVILGRETE